MSGKLYAVIGLIIGLMILGAGLYYWSKEKDNRESRKIYGIASLIGAVIAAAALIRLVIA